MSSLESLLSLLSLLSAFRGDEEDEEDEDEDEDEVEEELADCGCCAAFCSRYSFTSDLYALRIFSFAASRSSSSARKPKSE